MSWSANPVEKRQIHGHWNFRINQTYALLVDRPGITPVAVLPLSGEMSAVCGELDLLLLTGGGDPDPGLYGQECNGSVSPARERPVWEMELYRTARDQHLPVLGICLGLQLIAMAEGVPLVQDVPSQVPGALDHHGSAACPRVHPVTIAAGSFLHGVLGEEAIVSSFHHQAALSVPPGFRRSAWSSDGILEGMESDDGEVLAVQWHPERDYTGPLLLDAMIDRVRRGGDRRDDVRG